MNKLFILSAFAFLFSCKSSTEETTMSDTTSIQTNTTVPETTAATVTGCYLRVVQRDTLMASLVQDGNNITGRLVFDNYEKDGSRGDVSGVIDGDIIKLVYRFQSEGMSSISEEYFKRTKDGIILGAGDVQVKGDSVYYSQPQNILYQEKDVLKKISCDDIKIK